MTRRRIAVVGSGVAGLTAAYVLQRDADVTLYEADERLGGHADTHDVPTSDGRLRGIDTGFIVHNERTYPLLCRLFGELGVTTQESDMSMSISCGGCGLEYAGGRGLSGLLPSARTVANPRYLRMLGEIARFHRRARALLDRADDGQTVREFLSVGRFSPYFVAHFMTPLIAAVWSTAPTRTGDYPARYLFVFLANHGMLSVTGAPTWRTVVGGSARYVEQAVKGLTSVQTSTPVRTVTRVGGGVEIRDDADTAETFDGVVIAAHPHQALGMLATPSAAETAKVSRQSGKTRAISVRRAPVLRLGLLRRCAYSPPRGPVRWCLSFSSRSVLSTSSAGSAASSASPLALTSDPAASMAGVTRPLSLSSSLVRSAKWQAAQ
jgi:predicted NAD/FAD-binding protein